MINFEHKSGNVSDWRGEVRVSKIRVRGIVGRTIYELVEGAARGIGLYNREGEGGVRLHTPFPII